MFITWFRSFVVIAMSVCFFTSAIYVAKSNMGLTSVPQNISIQATYLHLGGNKISRITNMSFVLFKELTMLKLSGNGLTHIENGTFDHNAKLEKIYAKSNNIRQLPHSFGSAATRLRILDLWCALRDLPIGSMNFTEMIRLKWLNIECRNLHGVFHVSRLPRELETIGLYFARLTQFPDFARYTPSIAKIMVSGNRITEVPSEHIVESSTLKQVNLVSNRLSTVPDFYHLPLRGLPVSRNPIVCDQSLCWIHMWPWMKTPANIDRNIKCATPNFLQSVMLVDTTRLPLGVIMVRIIDNE